MRKMIMVTPQLDAFFGAKNFENYSLTELGNSFSDYIAFRQTISQKRVVETRGQHAYGHVKLPKDMGLIASEHRGRSMALKTTDYFADYFGLTQDTGLMKRELRHIFGDALKDDVQP